MEEYNTDAHSLKTNRSGYYIVPRGEVGEVNSEGRRKVVWQREGKKFYTTCPGCGNINTVNLICAMVFKANLSPTDCFVCHRCMGHFWITLKGAGRSLLTKFKRDSERCPVCGGLLVNSDDALYAYGKCLDCRLRFMVPRDQK